MYNILQSTHSYLAYIALIVLFLAATNAVLGFLNKKVFGPKDLRISLFAFILMHFQLLVGLVLYFTSPIGFSQLGNMKDSALRLTSLEHPLINIIAIILITIGWSKHKKEQGNKGKFQKIAIFYSIGLLLILARIPWNSWLN